METEKCLCGGNVVAVKNRVTHDVAKKCESCNAQWTVRANGGRHW